MSRRTTIVVVLLAIAGTAAAFLIGWSTPQADFTAKELYDQFAAAKPDAVPLFKQTITVYGRVESVSDSWLLPHGWVSVALSTGAKDEWVFCCIPPENVPGLRFVWEGQGVVIRGLCAGRFPLDFRVPLLTGCEVVD